MNMYDILQNNSGVNITINAGQLIEVVDYCVSKTRRELEQQINDAAAETYPSRQKVAELLDVDLSTLHRWKKQMYLVPLEIGGKRRYKMSDVKRILNGRVTE